MTTQTFVLTTLRERGPLSRKQLAAAAGCTSKLMSAGLTRLAHRGLVVGIDGSLWAAVEPGPGSATLQTEPAVNRDGTVTWVAHGTAGGIPYIAEGDSEDDAIAAACAVAFDRHGARRLRDLADLARTTARGQRHAEP